MSSTSDDVKGTQVDLGEDLLTLSSESQKPNAGSAYVSAGESIEERLHSARILAGESLFEEAKKVLHGILIEDSENMAARKALDEIHEGELKQIFREDQPAPRRKSPDDLWSHDSEAIIHRLDQELELGVLNEFPLFADAKAMEDFASNLERELVGAKNQDRVDLGVGFLEMGLYGLACRQFRTVAVSEGASSPAAALLAYSLVLDGKPFEAILVLQPAIQDVELPESGKVELLYLMGRAYEKMQSHERAIAWYRKAAEMEPLYRDLGDRLTKLSAREKSF